MSAELIDFATFQRLRLARPPAAPAGLTVLLPGWPLGWLAPVAVAIPLFLFFPILLFSTGDRR